MSFRNYLSNTARVATDILALIGIVAAIYGAQSAIHNALMDMIPNDDIVVRPICEKYIYEGAEYSDGQPAKVNLMGLHVKVKKDTNDLRFSLEQFKFIISWAVETDSFSQKQVDELLAHLPTGNVQNKRIFGDFPRVLKGTEIILQFKAVLTNSFECSSDWYHVSSESSDVIQLLPLNSYTPRGWEPKMFNVTNTLYWGFIVFLALLVLYLKYSLRKQQKLSASKAPNLNEPEEHQS